MTGTRPSWWKLAAAAVASYASAAAALDISQYGHTAWRIRDGSFKDPIESIAQTRDGYLWLGTDSGLLRFDGVLAVAWEPPSGTALKGKLIRALLGTRDGSLWIGTDRELASWKDGTLVQYELFDGFVFSLLEDRDGTVWAGGQTRDKKPVVCAIRGAKLDCHGVADDVGIGIMPQLQARDGAIWTVSVDRLWRWSPEPRKAYRLPAFASGIQVMAEIGSGAVLASLLDRIVQVAGDKVVPFPVAGVSARSRPVAMLTDSSGALWIGTTNGLVHFREGRTDEFQRSDGLSSDRVVRLFEDREGNIWVATADGLDRFHPLAAVRYGARQGLSGTVGSIVAARDGTVWIGTDRGVVRWRNGRIEDVKAATTGPNASSMFEDKHGRVWIGTRKSLGYLEQGRFIRLPGIPEGYVTSMAEDEEGGMWIAHEKAGLIHFGGDGMIERIPWSRLGSGYWRRLATDAVRGGLWAGSREGTLVHWLDGRVSASIAPTGGLGSVNHIRVSPDGAVWAATTKGLWRLRDGRFAKLDSHIGLPCDNVYSTIQDDEGASWLYTACGMARIAASHLNAWGAAADRGNPPPAIALSVLDYSDGVPNAAALGILTPFMTKSNDGKIWFRQLEGVGVVDPRHLSPNKLVPPMEIEAFIVDGKDYQSNSRVDLPPLVRDLEMRYTALSFVAPEKNRFRYKLEGRDKDWQPVTDRRRAVYTDLGPGTYRFRVIGSNNSGVWNEQGATLDFTVPPAWWQTLWFRFASVALAALVLWTLYVLRVRQIRANEAAVRASEARFRTFVDHALDAFFLFDEQLKVVDVNRQACEKLGFSREELIGMHVTDFDAALDERSVALLAERAGAGETITVETRHRRKDGTEFPVEIRSGSFKNGGRIFYLSLARDVTERKLAEEAVRGKDQALQMARDELARVSRVTTLGEMTASIAHEVNQPLAAMVANAGACARWLAAGPPEVGKARRVLESIAADGKRAGEIIGRIRGLTKRQAPLRARLDVNRKILDVLALAEAELRSREVAVETRLERELPPVWGDRVQLQQVLLNLIVNAMDAMDAIHDRPRTLTIVSKRDGADAVTVEVRDSGTGLDAQAAARVFEAFYTTKADGIGIGLSISRSIIESHGGRLWAEPNEPYGAVFRFTLPGQA